MTKRGLDRDFEAVSDEVLAELAAADRIALFVEAAAAGKDYWCERLVETCPQPHRWHTDLRFVMGAHHARALADHAVYELHTTYLHHRWLETIHGYELCLESERDDAAATEQRECAADRADELRAVFTRLYTTYHANRRFAEDVLEVDVRTWLRLHPHGPSVLDLVEDCLDDSLWEPTSPAWLTEEMATHGDGEGQEEQPDMDQLVDERVELLATTWESLLATAEPGGVL